MHNHNLLAAVTAILAVLPGSEAQGMYTKASPVLQVNARNFDSVIKKSNYTSIVEFYAPWCGHCRNLKPAYEKAARDLDGIAKVAAVDCDEDANKQLCGSLGIQGFPTLKIVRPSKSGRNPVIEDYQGQRTAAAIAEAVASKVNNHVTRLADKDIDAFLAKPKPKALLFTKKGTTSGLIRGIAIDFLDVISVGQVRDKETAIVAKFGVESYPALVLIPGEGKEPIVYDGEMKKKDMVKFLSQAGEPNPDPAVKGKPQAKKPAKDSKKQKKDEPKKEKKEETKQETKKETKEEVKKETKEEVKEEASTKSESEEPTAAEAKEEEETNKPKDHFIHIERVRTQADLEAKCLQPKSHTCVLLFYPADSSNPGEQAFDSLSHLATKYQHAGRHLFPFYAVAAHDESYAALHKALKLEDGAVSMIAINARRAWWRRYEGDYSHRHVEDWIDAVRMGDGTKARLPKAVIAQPEEKKEEKKDEEKEEEKIVHEEL